MPLRLEDRKWAQVKVILSILTPFWSCTLKLMGSESMNIHQTMRVYAYLQSQMDIFTEKLRMHPSPACTALLGAIGAASTKLEKYYSKTDKNPTYFLADYLLPHRKGSFFKKDWWINDDDNISAYEKYKKQLEVRFDNMYLKRPLDEQESAQVATQRATSFLPRTDLLRTQSLFNSSDMEDLDDPPPIRSSLQMASYLTEPKFWLKQTETQDVLAYWKGKQDIWPDLTLMARDVLAVPATGADVERLFSQGRNAITQHCHRLKSQTISDIMFCRGATKRKLAAGLAARVTNMADDLTGWCGDTYAMERWATFNDFRRLERQTKLPVYTMLFDAEHESELHATLLEMSSLLDVTSQESTDDITM